MFSGNFFAGFVMASVFIGFAVMIYRQQLGLSGDADSSPQPASPAEAEQFDHATRQMDDRLRSIERILDADTPGWRG